jgi:hypothetical protein
MHQHRAIEIVALLEFFAFAGFVFLFDTAGASQLTSSAPGLEETIIESVINEEETEPSSHLPIFPFLSSLPSVDIAIVPG